MNYTLLEPLTAAPPHTCAQLNAIHDAAVRHDHPLAALVILSILVPGIADVVSAIEVRHVNLHTGIVLIPVAGEYLHEVALGARAMAYIETLVADRVGGFLIADDHGAPIEPDADASDFAVELLTQVDPAVGEFEWSLDSLRSAAFDHTTGNGVSSHLLEASSGWLPLPPRGLSRTYAVLEQQLVGDYWSHLLELDRRLDVFRGSDCVSQGLCAGPSFDTFTMSVMTAGTSFNAFTMSTLTVGTAGSA